MYEIAYQNMQYYEPTIYNKLKESVFKEELTFNLNFVQKWGNMNFNVNASNYMHDFSLNNISFYSRFNINITKGLSVSLSGSVGLPRDQIYLPKRDLSEQDLLLRRHEVATQYTYWTNFGLTYRFGAKANNVVNTRFD